MAPIETYPNSAGAPLPPFPKTRSEEAARSPLIELEILVTLHCARIVEGSDKREPFSETTRTVLVSSHGAVVRLAAPLVPGQLIFLFNERTQKGVVCQVVESAPGGSASGFVELRFSEPAAGFWDLPIALAPPASVSAPPIAPANLETIPPVPPAAAKAAAPKPTAPVWTFVSPDKPTVAPLPLPVVEADPATRQFLGSANFASPSSVVPPVAAPPAPEVSPTQAGALPASSAVPPVPDAPNSATSTSSLRDFSKEISVLLAAALAAAPKPVATVPTFIAPVNPTMAPPPFPAVKPESATPQSAASTNSAPQSSVVPPLAAPLTPKISSAQAGTLASPAIPPAPVEPDPAICASSLLDFSKEVSAPARTNAPGSPQPSPVTSTAPRPSPAFSLPSVEQLMLAATPLQGSLDSPQFSATPPALPAPSAPPVAQKTKPPYAPAAKTVLEFARSEPEPVVKSEPESFLPGHQQIPPSVAVESCLGVSVSSEESIDVLVVEEPRRWQTEESDAGLLCKSPVQPDRVTSASPKKALTLGLAASVLLVLGAVTFYLRQDHSATRTPATAQALSTAPSPVSLRPAKNAAPVPSHAASATLATSQTPSAPIANWLGASALVEPFSSPSPVEPSPAPAATLDPQPGATPAAESQSTVSTGELTTAGASDAAAEPAPAEVPSGTTEVAEETAQRRPGVQLGGFEKPSAELPAFDPKKLPGICFSDSPMSGARNFLIVFYTSAESAQTELLTTAPSSSAASWPEGQGAFTTSYGSTWHYNHDETVGTTVTSLLPDDSPHGRPAHVSYAMAYTEDGMPISQRRPPTEKKKSKESDKPGKTRDESTGVYRELDALLGLVVTDIEKR